MLMNYDGSFDIWYVTKNANRANWRKLYIYGYFFSEAMVKVKPGNLPYEDFKMEVWRLYRLHEHQIMIRV